MREISEKCYRCECYWQNCDTDTECEGMKEPCHEFRECKRLKGEGEDEDEKVEL